MGEILKKPSAEVAAWRLKAKQTAEAVQTRLWDPGAGVFWDRLPNQTESAFVKVVTPATFWSLFSGIA
eukprot:COSAG03_NODE_28108_length_228_cov_8333.527132_1_plen_67_part_01